MNTGHDGHASTMLRTEGVPDTVARAIVACRRSRGRESMASLAASFGFDGFSYMMLSPSPQPRILEHWTSCGAGWTSRYAERGYHLVDPRVTLTRHRSVPIAWGAGDEREPRARAFLDDAARFDVRGGVAWSAFDARVGRAVVAWDCRHTEPPALGVRLGTIALLAGIVHEALALHCNSHAPARSDAGLTERERECLALAARGMTSADVGAKLGITTRTANFHIGNVIAKMGAVSRGEAIARAVSANLIAIGD